MSQLPSRIVLYGLLFVVAACSTPVTTADWPVYGGNTENTHYTTLDQISPENVAQLQVAWTFETGDESPGSEMQANPIVIDGIMYATTPKMHVFALNAATGELIWRFDPNNGEPGGARFRHRGVTVTGDRVIFNYRNRLYALDRITGIPIPSFGKDGWVDLREGLGRPVEGLSVSASTPGVVFEDLFIIGSSMSESLPSAPGDIRAYDVKTGVLRWSFHTIPHPGEFGYETWPPEAWQIAGGANAWSGVTIDTENAILFAATGSASYDFYGANRAGDNLFANSILALNARTGERIWHFQGIRHDLWDRDFPSPPSLITVKRDGRSVDAIAQVTKTGHVFVLERLTGEPLFPIEEVAMPGPTLPGEWTSPTQPFPVLPPSVARQSLTIDELTQRTPEAHASALATFHAYSTEGAWSTPDTTGIILYPGTDGGGEWGGPAFDPETGLLYVNSNEQGWLLKLVVPSDESLYRARCASCHGAERQGSGVGPTLKGLFARKSREDIAKIIQEGTGTMPAFSSLMNRREIEEIVSFLETGVDASAAKVGSTPFDLPYKTSVIDIFQDHEGYPGNMTPWGTLNAIDLNEGTIRWSIPFGVYPELAEKGMTDTGTDNYGGGIVTENGLFIIAATTYDKKIRAFDKLTGEVLWEADLPASGNATPSTYMVNGKQYIVIAAGGGKNGAASGGTYVAFALPDK
ncbi:MAG: pyrroloquinoline quinone-dependent dehydrogenase [Bacteroidetes bacterium]|nr:pyrroloquinoline quinone-dependent dehydrogenase [Bacteroidota bacterium]